jgi:hypothetical protein
VLIWASWSIKYLCKQVHSTQGHGVGIHKVKLPNSDLGHLRMVILQLEGGKKLKGKENNPLSQS